MANPVPLVMTDDQDEFRSTLRRFLGDRISLERTRQSLAADKSFDPSSWRQLANEIGVQGLTIPTRLGGAGAGPVENLIAFEELGRVLYSGPMLATVGMAVPVLIESGDERMAQKYLPKIAEGELIAAVAVAGLNGSWSDPTAGVMAVPTSEGWRLTGSKYFVLDALAADLLLVTAAAQDSGPSIFAVEAKAVGLKHLPMDSLDLTREIARIDLADVPAQLVGTTGDAGRVLDAAYDRILVAVAAEQVGLIDACLTMATDYAKQREQFGRPIGSFQAVAHKLVDMLGEARTASAVAHYAAASLAVESPETGTAVRVASAYCAQAAQLVTTEAIEVFGGIGFTWEHDAHFFYRRALSTRALFGEPRTHWLALADRMGL
jgi:alkylation response protein AidB-like acyl-CoA dehydrogenase